MNYFVTDELYRDALINIKEFTQVGYVRSSHHHAADPSSKETKDTIHPWPNQYAIDRFHRKHRSPFMKELADNNIEVLDNEFVFAYLLERQDYAEDHKDHQALEDRFTRLRAYLAAERLRLWEREDAMVEITLRYRGKLPEELLEELRVSNSLLLYQLLDIHREHDLSWRLQVKGQPDLYLELDFAVTELVFIKMGVYRHSFFNMERKPEDERLHRGYVLQEDKERWQRIADGSYDNFKQLVTDIEFYQNIKIQLEKYREPVNA